MNAHALRFAQALRNSTEGEREKRTRRRRKEEDSYKRIKINYELPKTLMDMPTEILLKIFADVPCVDLRNRVGPSCHRLMNVVGMYTSNAFIKISLKLCKIHTEAVKWQKSCYCGLECRAAQKFINILEILAFHYEVCATTMFRQLAMSSDCMFGGKVLDLFEEFFRSYYARSDKAFQLVHYDDNELPILILSIKGAILNFIEEYENRESFDFEHANTSGCKIIDILDLAMNSQKTVEYAELRNDVLFYKVRYLLPYSWFVCMDCPAVANVSDEEKLRAMVKRVRKMVISHTEMAQANIQYAAERQCYPNRSVRPVPNAVYTGYGSVGNRFFYYGSMNQQFHWAHRPPFAQNSYRKRTTGVLIYCEVICPVNLAPISYLRNVIGPARSNLFTAACSSSSEVLKMIDMSRAVLYSRAPAGLSAEKPLYKKHSWNDKDKIELYIMQCGITDNLILRPKQLLCNLKPNFRMNINFEFIAGMTINLPHRYTMSYACYTKDSDDYDESDERRLLG